MFRWGSLNGSFSSLFILCCLIFSLVLIYDKTTRSIDISPRERIMCHTSHTFVELFSLLALYSRIYTVSSPCFMAFTHTHIHRPRVIRSHHEKKPSSTTSFGQANFIKYKTIYKLSYHSCAKNIIWEGKKSSFITISFKLYNNC